jgi:hypothetical protein
MTVARDSSPGPKGLPQNRWRNQPRVSTGFQPWELDPPHRRALQGRQIESTNNVEVGVQWVRCGPGNYTTSFCATMDANSPGIRRPFSFQGEPLF